MSLRRRLLLVLFMSAVGLAAAGVAVRQAVNQGQAARERSGLATAEALARSAARGAGDGARANLRALLGSMADVSAGLCRPDGTPGPFSSNGGWGEPVDRPPPRDVRDVLTSLCRQGGTERAGRVAHPHDVILIAAADSAGARGWAAVHVTAGIGARREWLWPVALLTLATLVLSVVTVDALRALDRGTSQLRAGLRELERDLRAPFERPRAGELALVADGLRGMARHLADAQERERELARRLAHEQRLAALGRVAAGLAHEVRNPLAGLKLRLDIARRSQGVPLAVLSELTGSLDEVARLDRLVASLLVVARPQNRKAPPAPFDVGGLIDERLALLGPWADRLGVVVRRVGTANAQADRDAVGRVVDNLVRNAVEAASSGEVLIEVGLRDGQVVVAVKDRGPGVSSPEQLFEPFASTKRDGTGLGLFIARALLESMGGSISYVREPPWTTFQFALPMS